jgi:hypothetical protein
MKGVSAMKEMMITTILFLMMFSITASAGPYTQQNCGLTVLNTRDNQQYLKTVDLNQAMLEAAAIRGRNRWDNKGLITQGCAGRKTLPVNSGEITSVSQI